MNYKAENVLKYLKGLYELTAEKLSSFMNPGGLELAMAGVPGAGFGAYNIGSYSRPYEAVHPVMYSVKNGGNGQRGNGASTIEVKNGKVVVAYGSETVSLDPLHVQHNPSDYAGKKLPAKRFPKDIVKKAAKELEKLIRALAPAESAKNGKQRQAYHYNKPAVLRK